MHHLIPTKQKHTLSHLPFQGRRSARPRYRILKRTMSSGGNPTIVRFSASYGSETTGIEVVKTSLYHILSCFMHVQIRIFHGIFLIPLVPVGPSWTQLDLWHFSNLCECKNPCWFCNKWCLLHQDQPAPTPDLNCLGANAKEALVASQIR